MARRAAAPFVVNYHGHVVWWFIICLVALGSSTAGRAETERGAEIVTYRVANYGSREDHLFVTFGAAFARGDVPPGTKIEAVDEHGTVIPLQVDRKATHPDGSLRHAVVTLLIPHLGSGQEMPVTLRRSERAIATDVAVSTSSLPSDFDAVVDLNLGGHHLVATARALLAQGRPETWLSGPLVTEWWVSGPFTDGRGVADPHLYARFGIRCYGKGQPLRLDIAVENDWTFVPHPRTEVYDAEIRIGGKIVFTKTGMIQPAQTRWRKGFWWSEPVSVYVKQNLDYLKKARVIPNYDPDLHVSEKALANTYKRFEASDRDPMGAGTIMKYMPTTGGRPDIAPLPQWQAMYLLSMDPRAYQMTLQEADLGAGFPSHYRNKKTGSPTVPEDDPNISTDGDLFGRPGQLEVPDTGGYRSLLIPDTAHEPALDFVPYLVTGDRFYLEELEFWAEWNAMDCGPKYHGFATGLVSWGQERGQAWSLRTLAQAEYIAPDNDPLKPVLRRQLKANIAWYDARYVNNQAANALHIVAQPDAPYDGGRGFAPWQDDFFTWSIGYVQSLGDAAALPLLRWKAGFAVGRMTAPAFCWVLAPSYTLLVRDSAEAPDYNDLARVYRETVSNRFPGALHSECASPDMAAKLGLHVAGEMIQHAEAPDGYSAYLQAALAAAVDSGSHGADAAWKLFQSRSVHPDYEDDPTWDIVPWPTRGMRSASP
ncbi:MAG TPA: hypothetical protein VHY79_14545 [Rhizomicrobium sp.]|jgi:hypothetical protein|nr:hypothetical protein [Rhizomicrobium sp.]